ncbi:Pentatricopeptide repeat-containing protein, chloroplastic, partial [Ananas comosus]
MESIQREDRAKEANPQGTRIGSFLTLLAKCGTLRELERVLAPMIVIGLLKDRPAIRKVVKFCASRYIENSQYASSLLRYLNDPHPFLWNTLIRSFEQTHKPRDAIKLYKEMLCSCVCPDKFTFPFVLKACASDWALKEGEQIHCRVAKSPLSMDLFVQGSSIFMYASCGRMGSAKAVPFKDEVTWGIMINGYANSNQIGLAHCWFEKMPNKNLITWNCLLGGYAKCGDVRAAHQLFNSMPFRNLTSWNTMLDAYAKHGKMELAFQLFNLMPLKDVVSWNILIDGHNKIGNVQLAQELFDIMPYRDVVSWNLMLSGYKENGLLKKAVDLFFHMHLLGEKPDCFTLAIVLSAIADLGLIVQGRWVHAYAERSKFSLDGNIGVSLIDMYSKCGYVDLALNIFDNIQLRNIDHWNAMISGLAIHGYGHNAVSLFEGMKKSTVKPDDITFIGVLSACSHAGLVYEGYQYFKLMSMKYGIIPKIQHYGCMVDLLGRAGFLEAAVAIVNSMPMAPNDVVWRALLGASRSHGNLEIAEQAARRLINMVPHDSSSFVLLSNIYVYKGQFKSARDVWKIMKENGVLKNPGLSYIELNGFLHEFSAGDTSHPQTMEIYLILKCMIPALMLAGHVPGGGGSVGDWGAGSKAIFGYFGSFGAIK